MLQQIHFPLLRKDQTASENESIHWPGPFPWFQSRNGVCVCVGVKCKNKGIKGIYELTVITCCFLQLLFMRVQPGDSHYE